MTRKLKRSPALEISLVIKDEQFIHPPHEEQRNALLNKALEEFNQDLIALDRLSRNFVTGKHRDIVGDRGDRTQMELSADEIMEDWQIPIMRAMAQVVAGSGGDVLEIGFGLGISASMIQEYNVRSHTIIECNDSVVARFHDWKEQHQQQDIRLVHGLWQDTIDTLGLFDGIFFHTYPLNEQEYLQYVTGSVTFAAHFFETAAAHLGPGGVFTYFSHEIDSLSRAHQRLLLEHFSSFSVQVVALDMPDGVQDTWWADSMVVVKASK